MITVPDQLEEMNGDKEISAFEVTVMIGPPDWMLRDFLVIPSNSEAAREGHNNQGQGCLGGFCVIN